MAAFLAGFVALVFLMLLARGYVSIPSRWLATGFRRSAGFLLMAAAIAFEMTGRLIIAMFCAAGASFLLFGSVSPWSRPNPANGQAGGAGGQRRNEMAAQSAMSRSEALKVLGLEAAATAADIRTAHRRLIQQNHPDKGGSDYLASKINQAKDVLLRKK